MCCSMLLASIHRALTGSCRLSIAVERTLVLSMLHVKHCALWSLTISCAHSGPNLHSKCLEQNLFMLMVNRL